MSIGKAIRRLLGPLEPIAIRLYRASFFDVAAFARAVRAWTEAGTILEVGCGDGQATEELQRAFLGVPINGAPAPLSPPPALATRATPAALLRPLGEGLTPRSGL